MNFDANTLSTLMQLMNSQKSRESESNYSANDGSANYYQNTANGQSKPQSVFAVQNGLGQRVDFSGKPENKSQSAANPTPSIFDMLSGKGGSANSDMMTNLLPMFMNMMSKPAQVAGGANKNGSQSNQSFEQKLKSAMNNASGNDGRVNGSGDSADNKTAADTSGETTQSGFGQNNENAQNRQSNRMKSSFNRDKYSPVSFAGYALICALNKLYTAKRLEYFN